ncbi:MAG: adenosine kinase, partial [Actinomycetota bacterium]
MRANPDLPLDVVGVGNAIVDVISTVPEAFLAEHGLVKGAMTLIDTERATSLYGSMPPGIETSGGSAANTMAGVASLGGRSTYIGKVRDDQLGEVFAHDTRNGGVAFDVPFATEGEPTARSLIQVTPDGERTMNTFLGISAFLSPSDVETETVESAAITYCE